jgi:hypothetical protein
VLLLLQQEAEALPGSGRRAGEGAGRGVGKAGGAEALALGAEEEVLALLLLVGGSVHSGAGVRGGVVGEAGVDEPAAAAVLAEAARVVEAGLPPEAVAAAAAEAELVHRRTAAVRRTAVRPPDEVREAVAGARARALPAVERRELLVRPALVEERELLLQLHVLEQRIPGALGEERGRAAVDGGARQILPIPRLRGVLHSAITAVVAAPRKGRRLRPGRRGGHRERRWRARASGGALARELQERRRVARGGDGGRRGREAQTQVFARLGHDGVEQRLGAEGEADHLLLAVVLDEEEAHDLGGVVRVQCLDPRKHHLGGLVGVHGRGSAKKRPRRREETRPWLLPLPTAPLTGFLFLAGSVRLALPGLRHSPFVHTLHSIAAVPSDRWMSV